MKIFKVESAVERRVYGLMEGWGGVGLQKPITWDWDFVLGWACRRYTYLGCAVSDGPTLKRLGGTGPGPAFVRYFMVERVRPDGYFERRHSDWTVVNVSEILEYLRREKRPPINNEIDYSIDGYAYLLVLIFYASNLGLRISLNKIYRRAKEYTYVREYKGSYVLQTSKGGFETFFYTYRYC